MTTVTIPVSENKTETLKIIANIEKRNIEDILSELIEEYIERHDETLELISNLKHAALIKKGKNEVKKGVKGKTLAELEDWN